MNTGPRPCSGKETVRKLKVAGWRRVRHKGSHVMMTKPEYPYTLSIPLHKELGVGILSKIIKQAGISAEEFDEL